jgi:YD repeat-containing protein
MKVIFDMETDTLSIILRDGSVAESDEPRPALILDYDKADRLVSIELLDESEQVPQPQSGRVHPVGREMTDSARPKVQPTTSRKIVQLSGGER